MDTRREREEGVVLRRLPYGESDEIVTVLFRRSGVRRLFAPSSRVSKRRFPGGLDVFSRLILEFEMKPAGLGRLHGAERLDAIAAAGADLGAFALGHYLAEIIGEFVPEGFEGGRAFAVWEGAALRLKAEGFSPGLAGKILLDALAAFGYAMAWGECAVCGVAEFPSGVFFSPPEGGMLCPGCAGLKRVDSARELAEWRPDLQNCDPPARVARDLIAYVRYLLDKRARSEAFLLGFLAG